MFRRYRRSAAEIQGGVGTDIENQSMLENGANVNFYNPFSLLKDFNRIICP